MVKIGDRVRLSGTKGPNREGVVTAVTGSLLRLRWPSGEETTVVPAAGTLSVLTTGEGARPKVAKKNQGEMKGGLGARKKAADKPATSKIRAPKKTKKS